MIEALSFDFVQQAILAGLLASAVCGLIGSLVVVNRLVFLAGGIAHAAYGGVGLAFFFGWPVLPSLIGFSVAASGAMASVSYERHDRADTLIGVLWAAGMAFGIILLDFIPGYRADLMSYLFGSILTVLPSDLWIMGGLVVVLFCSILFLYKPLLALSFDREFARTRGIKVRLLHFLLLAMVALSVVILIRVVGLILVIALLTIPPALAEKQTSSLGAMMAVAAAWCALFCLSGLALAYVFDLTAGAVIIAVACVTYGVFAGVESARRKFRTKVFQRS